MSTNTPVSSKENFRVRFQTYSTSDLLVAVNKREVYNPLAIEVMEEILRTRTIEESDQEEAAKKIAIEEAQLAEEKQKTEDLKNRFIDFFEPIIYPTREVDASKWLNLFMLVLAIETLYSLYSLCKTIYYFVNDTTYITFLFVQCITPIVDVVQFYMSYKRLKAGWIFMVFVNCFVITYSISMYFLFGNAPNLLEFISEFFLALLFNVAFVMFLQKPATAELFGIENQNRKQLNKRIIASCIVLVLPYVYIKLCQLGIL